MTVDRILDWVPRHDPESENYPIRGAVRKAIRISSRAWKPPHPLDQGREGACVGFGWTHEALSTPIAVRFERAPKVGMTDPDAVARRIYREAQRIDEWAGESYEGTSVLAGAKVMKSMGLLKEYRWAFSVEDVVAALLTTGPVVLGVPWYESMYEAPGGIVEVGGDMVGGHCLLARAVAAKGRIFPDERAIGWLNSWGPEYGENGLAWIPESKLAWLLRQDGEACVPFRRSYGLSA
jgi:hypothetical protein